MTRHVRRLAAQFFSLLLLAALITLGIAPTVGLASTASAASADASTNTKLSVDLASPAVVRIISNVSGQVVCKTCGSNNQDIVFPLNGGSYNLQFSGSGAFIAPDGYILTADHVVDFSNDEDILVDFLNAAINEAAQTFGQTTDEMTATFNELINENLIAVPTQVTSQKVFLSTSYTGQLQNSAQVEGFDVTRIVANSPVNKQDTAIIKVEANDMPFLKLASASSIKVQDTVTAVAYPGDADTGDFTTLFSPTTSDVNTVNSLLSVSVNNGQVAAQKTLSDGTPVYETTGISSAGSSGGPVLDEKGAIIGFVDAGPANDRITLLIPSEVVTSYVQQAGITKPTGTFMTQWTKAITEYDATGACHFTNAASDFKKIQTSYPNFGAIHPFLQDAQSKATPSECPAPAPLGGIGGLLALCFGLLVVIAVVVVAIVVLSRRNRQPKVAPAGVPTASYGYGAPATPNMYGQPTPQMPGQTPYLPQPQTPAPQQPYGMNAPTGPVSGAPYSAPPAPTPYPNQPQTPYPAQPQAGYPAPAQPQTPYPAQPQTPYAAPTQPPYVAPAQPQTPYAAPVPQQPQAPVYGTPAPQQPATPYPPAPAPAPAPAPIQPAAAPVARMCTNGHPVADPMAMFCPQCGAPVNPPPQQA